MAQSEFLVWIKDGSYNSGINPAIPVINWLFHIMATKKLRWLTVFNRKIFILALFHNPDIITSDSTFKAFIAAGHSIGVVDTKHIAFSITPVLRFFRDSLSNQDKPMVDLAKKLCWLLGVYGFLRPDDIYFLHRYRSFWLYWR